MVRTRPQRRDVLEGDWWILPPQTGSGTGNRPFNDLWLALMPKFGVDGSVLTNAINAGTYTTGISGAPMSTGPLAGLFA